MKDISDRNLIVETTLRMKPSQRRVSHRLIGEERFLLRHRYRTACGLALNAREVRPVLTRDPTCENCQRRGSRKWRFSKSN